MSLVWIVARRHHLHWVLLLALVEVILLRTVRGTLAVPGRGDGAEWVIRPLLPSLPAIMFPAAAAVVFSESERVMPVPVSRRRMTLVLVQLAIVLVTATLGSASATDAAMLVRNGLIFGSIALAAAALLPAELAWSPVVLAATATWIIGVPEPGAAVPGWALPLLPTHQTVTWFFGAGAQCMATCLYLARERHIWSAST